MSFCEALPCEALPICYLPPLWHCPVIIPLPCVGFCHPASVEHCHLPTLGIVTCVMPTVLHWHLSLVVHHHQPPNALATQVHSDWCSALPSV